MKVLLDSNSLQARAHLGVDIRPEWEEVKGRRLTTFLGLLKETFPDADVEFYGGKYTGTALADCRLLIFLTRKTPFEAEELEAIHGYVRGGGGLLIMSNHGRHAEHDGVLARRFGFGFEPSFFRALGGEVTWISEGLLGDHPVIKGEAGEPGIQNLVTKTTCHITARSGRVLATLSERMKEKFQDLSPRGTVFALALDGRQDDLGEGVNGRIVAVADSGFAGSKGADKPGVGLIEEGDNIRFFARVFRWLTA